ncbi:MAG TPA: Rid family detoxifying hydrolase [Candidatus Acidoferrum sp.]|nr:Rid family detoxifying hydrolase [Candidatus Acidoferrum sp.]
MKRAISTNEAPGAPAFLSQAITSNGLIFVSGQVHNLPDNTLVGETVAEKLAQIMKNIETILKAADASLNDVVKVTIYVTDMAMMPEINKAYPAYFAEPFPAREAVCVAGLPLNASVELSVIAVKA